MHATTGPVRVSSSSGPSQVSQEFPSYHPSAFAILLVCLAWSLWISIEYWGFGSHSYVFLHDEGDGWLPGLISAAHHGMQAWSPEWAAGVDRNAAGMSPWALVFLFRILPGWLAYGAFLWLQRFIAAYFTVRFARDCLRLSLLPSAVAGLAFSLMVQPWLNGTLGFRLYDGLAIPAIPLVLWALHRAQRHSQAVIIATATLLGIGLGVSTSYAVVPFVFPLLLVWILFFSGTEWTKRWSAAAALTLASVIAIAPVLIAALRESRFSSRLSWNLDSALFPAVDPHNWLVLAASNAPWLLLACGGLLAARFRCPRLNFFVAAGILCLAPRLFWHFILRLMAILSPRLHGFQGDRVYLLVPFLFCVAGGFGLEWIGKRRPALASVLGATAIALLLSQSLWVKSVSLRQMVQGYRFDALYENPQVKWLAAVSRSSPPFRVATVFPGTAGEIHPAYAWAYGLESADGYLSLYPASYKEFWAQLIAPSLQRDASLRRYFEDWGSRIYLWRSVAIQPPVPLNAICRLDLLSLDNVRFLLSSVELRDDRLILRSSPPTHAAYERLPWRKRLGAALDGSAPAIPFFVYENTAALPRFFLARTAPQASDLSEMATRDATALRSEAFGIAGSQPSPAACADSPVVLESYAADRIQLNATSPGNCALVVTNNYSPAWSANVDGVTQPVLRVDHTFQAVLLGSGLHHVELRYHGMAILSGGK